jgi:glutamate-ammonia-ligase adenylyltransferase
LKNKERRLSDNFIQELRRTTTGYLPSEIFDKLLESFEEEISKSYFSSSVEANLHRMIFSLFDKVSFLSDAVKFPHYIQIIISIAVNSNYLTDIIIRNPEYLYWIISPENLKSRITDEYL